MKNLILYNGDGSLRCFYGIGRRFKQEMLDRINREKWVIIKHSQKHRWYDVWTEDKMIEEAKWIDKNS